MTGQAKMLDIAGRVIERHEATISQLEEIVEELQKTLTSGLTLGGAVNLRDDVRAAIVDVIGEQVAAHCTTRRSTGWVDEAGAGEVKETVDKIVTLLLQPAP